MGQPVPTLSHESRFRLSPLKSHLRNHGGSGVKVHSAGNLRVPQSPPRCRNPAKVEEGCEKDFSTSRHTHTHTHTWRWHFDAKIPIEANSGRLVPGAPLQKPQKKEGSR